MTSQSIRPLLYPFTAIVGQETLKQALVINAVNPRVGGALIRGEKGTAKSTAVRAMAALLPTIEVVDGCGFSCDPNHPPRCPTCSAATQFGRASRPVRIVDLPIGTTEDRLLGTLDLERAIKTGERHFEPGLLAHAHRGILYVDEVNLLGDHLVDVLLDVAAMGINVVEREGISFTHPAEIILIGTMNPEEGELRPQLLDRFGLSVEVHGLAEPRDRAEVVRRRVAFERDPSAFVAQWQDSETRERVRIARARDLLTEVHLADELIDLIAQFCATAQVDGLRADITIHNAALTIAALAGRREVVVDDVRLAAELVLPHRQRRRPFEQPQLNREQIAQTIAEFEQQRSANEMIGNRAPQVSSSSTSGETDPFPLPEGTGPGEGSESTTPSAQRNEANDQPASECVYPPNTVGNPLPHARRGQDRYERNVTGRRNLTLTRPRQGQVISARLPESRPRDLAIGATLRAAAPQQRHRQDDGANTVALRIEPGDLREAVRRGRTRDLILFVVDASGSMGARQRMAAAKGAMLSLLVDAYQRRDLVGLIAFRGERAELLLPPTNSVELAEQRLRDLPTGGRSPIGHGLALAAKTLARAQNADPEMMPFLVVVSDGRANVSLFGGDPVAESQQFAGEIAVRGIQALVVDCESGSTRLGLARALSLALGAQYRRLEELTAAGLADAVETTLRKP